MKKLYLVACALFLFTLSCTGSKKVTIYRDTWGVPHIYASDDVSLAFGMGYAQAEDRIEQLMMNYRWALGRMAEVLGPRYVGADSAQLVWAHGKVAEKGFERLEPELQKMLKAFVAGVNAYLNDHPDKKPAVALEIEPWYPIALGRAFIWGWPLGQAIDDYNKGQSPYDPRGSNQWAVSGERTASGAPILLVDPHLSWYEEGHWFEVRLHGEEIHSCGMSVTGTPFVGLGHNRSLAWAATTGGPDCGDCYEEILNPDNPNQVMYDGGWEEINRDTLRIAVRKDDQTETVVKIVEKTRHGPIYKKKGTSAYSLAIPYSEEFELIEQMLAMNKAQNVDEFKAALSALQFMPQNMMVADNSGNIYYQRTGRVPIRDLQFDWSRPVPGWKKETDWQGIHSPDDLVQLLNPPQGFMQNCNISPGTMLPSSPMVESAYRSYLYNDRTDRTNSRGKRAVALLESDQDLTFEEAQAVAMDVKIPDLEPIQNQLELAFRESPRQDIREQVQRLTTWDGSLDRENRTAPLFAWWLQMVMEELDIHPYQDKMDLDAGDRQKLLSLVADARQALIDDFGTDDIAWGDVQRLKRGEAEYPLGGGNLGRSLSALRSVWGQKKEGRIYGSGGQTGPMVIELTKPVRSVSTVPWGQSDDPESPHYFDQGEKLFQYRKMKPTWFEWEELKDNIESRKELEFSPNGSVLL